jgi:hypothetical protein
METKALKKYLKDRRYERFTDPLHEQAAAELAELEAAQTDYAIKGGEMLVELARLRKENEQLEATVENLKGMLSSDPHLTATKEQREAWRLSAIRYSNKLEAENTRLRAYSDNLEGELAAEVSQSMKLRAENAKLREAGDDGFYQGLLTVADQMKAIPNGNFYHADRYDTDDTHVIHLWDDNGHSFDIRVPQEHALHDVRNRLSAYAHLFTKGE